MPVAWIDCSNFSTDDAAPLDRPHALTPGWTYPPAAASRCASYHLKSGHGVADYVLYVDRRTRDAVALAARLQSPQGAAPVHPAACHEGGLTVCMLDATMHTP